MQKTQAGKPEPAQAPPESKPIQAPPPIPAQETRGPDALALATIPPQGQQLQAIVTSLDASTLAGKKAILNARNGQDGKLLAVVGQTLLIRDYLLHPVQIVDKEQGEEIESIRCVLVTVKGERYACVSGGIVNSLRAICQIFGNGPWKDGLAIRPVEQSTRAGYRTLVLEVA